VRHLRVWLESGLARWLPSQAPRHDGVTHHCLFGSVLVAVHVIRVRHWCDLGRRGALDRQRVTFNGLAVLPYAIHKEAEFCEAEWPLALESHGLVAAHQRVVVIVGEVVTNRNAGVVGEHRQREGRWLRWVVLFLLQRDCEYSCLGGSSVETDGVRIGLCWGGIHVECLPLCCW